jgi:uncharacterized protein (UPF0335 family)
MPVAAPAWKWEWNPNTVVSVAGFSVLIIGGFVAWGYVVAEFRGALATHTVDLDRLDKRLTKVEAQMRILDAHELRITTVEGATKDAAASVKALEGSINSVGSDVRVVKEILQRLEAMQSNNRRP